MLFRRWRRSADVPNSETSTTTTAEPDPLVTDKSKLGTEIQNSNQSSGSTQSDDIERKKRLRRNKKAKSSQMVKDTIESSAAANPQTLSRQTSPVAVESRPPSPPTSLWRGRSLRNHIRHAEETDTSGLSVDSAPVQPATHLDTDPRSPAGAPNSSSSFIIRRLRSRKEKRAGDGPRDSAKKPKQPEDLRLSPVESAGASSTIDSTISSRESTVGSTHSGANDDIGTLRSQPSTEFSQRRVRFDEVSKPVRDEKTAATSPQRSTSPRREPSLRAVLARRSNISALPSPTASDAGDHEDANSLPEIVSSRSPSPLFLRRRVASDTDVFFPAYPPLAIPSSSPLALARPTATHYFPPQSNPRNGPPTTFHFQQPSPYPHPMSETVSRIHSRYLSSTVCVYPPLPGGNAAQKMEWRANAMPAERCSADDPGSPGRRFVSAVPESGIIGGSGAGGGIFVGRRR